MAGSGVRAGSIRRPTTRNPPRSARASGRCRPSICRVSGRTRCGRQDLLAVTSIYRLIQDVEGAGHEVAEMRDVRNGDHRGDTPSRSRRSSSRSTSPYRRYARLALRNVSVSQTIVRAAGRPDRGSARRLDSPRQQRPPECVAACRAMRPRAAWRCRPAGRGRFLS